MLNACTEPDKFVYKGEDGSKGKRFVSIEYLWSLYNGKPLTISDDIYISGFISANDRSGNYNNAISISDGTAPVEIKIDMNNIFVKYSILNKVEVSCSSLTLGSYGGVLQLGLAPSGKYETSYIPQDLVHRYVKKVDGYPPAHFHEWDIIDISEVANYYPGTHIYFRDVQFVEYRVRWCDTDPETGEPVDTTRTLIDREGNTIGVRISKNAIFADVEMPDYSGSMGGILTLFNGKYELKGSSTTDIRLSDERF